MPMHEKYAPLSDAAFRLAITAGCWCSERMTDGFIPKTMVPQLTAAPRGKKLVQCIAELTRETPKLSPVWEDRGDEYELHDFLDWNMSRSEWEAKVAAASAGGRAKAAKGSAKPMPCGSHMAEQVPAICYSKSLPSPLPDSDSDSDLENKNPPNPPAGGKPNETARNCTGSKPARVPKAARAIRSHAPDILEPTDATLAVAQECGREWRRDWESLRDWALAKGELKADWQAALRGWMRRSAEQFGTTRSAAPVSRVNAKTPDEIEREASAVRAREADRARRNGTKTHIGILPSVPPVPVSKPRMDVDVRRAAGLAGLQKLEAENG
jgi:hypothetical protein